jgi:hypothetical protein
VVEDLTRRVLQLEAILENLHPFLVCTMVMPSDKLMKAKILEQLYALMPWVKEIR